MNQCTVRSRDSANGTGAFHPAAAILSAFSAYRWSCPGLLEWKSVNLYRSRWRLYPARPLRPAPGSPAVIENFDLDAADCPLRARWLNHLSFTDSPAVQALVLRRILEVVRGAEPPESDDRP